MALEKQVLLYYDGFWFISVQPNLQYYGTRQPRPYNVTERNPTVWRFSIIRLTQRGDESPHYQPNIPDKNGFCKKK